MPLPFTLDRTGSLLFALCLLPLLRLSWIVFSGEAINPVEFMIRSTGTWSISLLWCTLAITPLRTLPGMGRLIRRRRMLGLFAFFYATLHLALYITLERGFDVRDILHDVLKRPFITLGMLTFLLMLPLAITSSDGWIRRLKRHWGQLHRLIYPLSLTAVLHYAMLVKRDLTQPAIYAFVLAGLLGWRLLKHLASRKPPLSTPATTTPRSQENPPAS